LKGLHSEGIDFFLLIILLDIENLVQLFFWPLMDFMTQISLGQTLMSIVSFV